MTVSALLRLLPEALEKGEIKGEVVVVANGETRVVRNVTELIEFLREADAGQTARARGEKWEER